MHVGFQVILATHDDLVVGPTIEHPSRLLPFLQDLLYRPLVNRVVYAARLDDRNMVLFESFIIWTRANRGGRLFLHDQAIERWTDRLLLIGARDLGIDGRSLVHFV